MPRNKISDNIEGIVKYLFTKKYSYYVIQQELARMNLNVSKSTISRIANKVGKQRQLCLLNSEKAKFHRRRHIATSSIVRRITSYINKENPPTISLMAARCHISVGTTVRIIRDIIHGRCRKKKDQYIDFILLLLRRDDLELGVCTDDYQMISIRITLLVMKRGFISMRVKV